jgi:hypothetical protein
LNFKEQLPEQRRGAHYTDQICFVNPFFAAIFTADVPANLLSLQPRNLLPDNEEARII